MTEPPAWHTAAVERARREAFTVPEPVVRATEYTVCCLPESDVNYHQYAVYVRDCGDGRYAVVGGGNMCLGTDGSWDYGVNQRDRGDEWLSTHRFDLETALRLAQEQARLVVVNGRTVADVLHLGKQSTGQP